MVRIKGFTRTTSASWPVATKGRDYSVYAETVKGRSSPHSGVPQPSPAAARQQASQERDAPSPTSPLPKVTNLPNHLMVATTERQSPAVGLVWKLPAGSKYERSETAGFSHFLRHALFLVRTSRSQRMAPTSAHGTCRGDTQSLHWHWLARWSCGGPPWPLIIPAMTLPLPSSAPTANCTHGQIVGICNLTARPRG